MAESSNKRRLEFGIFVKELSALLTQRDVAQLKKVFTLQGYSIGENGDDGHELLSELAATKRQDVQPEPVQGARGDFPQIGAEASQSTDYLLEDPRYDKSRTMEDIFRRIKRSDLADYCFRFSGAYRLQASTGSGIVGTRGSW
eukprot:scpid95548/ scgid24315/ 